MKKKFYKIVIKFFNYLNKKQEDKHKKRMEAFKNSLKKQKNTISGVVAGSKIHQNSCATLTISSSKERDVDNLKLEKILLASLKEPKKLFDYIKGAQTKVYLVKYANKVLSFISEDEGFIYPKKGFKALYLNLLLEHKISFETKEMFVLRTLDVNVYAFMYQFYNWYCYKMKLSGFEVETQEKFKDIFKIYDNNQIDDLSLNEILALKSAIKRDKDAIDFVLNFTKKYSTSKETLEKIKLGQTVNV